jgi:hypothetical protein
MTISAIVVVSSGVIGVAPTNMANEIAAVTSAPMTATTPGKASSRRPSAAAALSKYLSGIAGAWTAIARFGCTQNMAIYATHCGDSATMRDIKDTFHVFLVQQPSAASAEIGQFDDFDAR